MVVMKGNLSKAVVSLFLSDPDVLELEFPGGTIECGVNILKWYVKEHGYKADLSMVDMLVSLCIENHDYSEALQHSENTKEVLCPGSEWLMYLTIKEGICCVHLGDMEKAEVYFSLQQQVSTEWLIRG
ncbi:hypothetical protein Droror1_Dr00022486 [Drosera rotundifolia]